MFNSIAQGTLLHDFIELGGLPLLTFHARARHARRQPASVLLRFIAFVLAGDHPFVLVGDHHTDPLPRTRLQALGRQLFSDLFDFEPGLEAVSDADEVALSTFEPARAYKNRAII